MPTPEHPPQDVHVTVTFALAPRPYQHRYAPRTSIGMVEADALVAFEVTTDGTTTYELVYDGEVVPPDKTVGDLARHGHQLRLGLRTVTTAG
ncbi:hypothetical protein [Streptomyces sp. NBC_01314]|uniref:hypothetical protein n=1 Tax=Streptomyces sp. NBC_01314 TaxID=2903821 RepID=UPI00308C9C27|nr:hypothetical protein OG622_29125 [Streptomyces sp. NBC_01314]